MFLPGAGRLWGSLGQRWLGRCRVDSLEASEFAKRLIDLLPLYDEVIIREIRPSDGWIGKVDSIEWMPSFHKPSQFHEVLPDLTTAWKTTAWKNL